MFRTAIAALITILLLTACASNPALTQLIAENAKGVQGAEDCCTDVPQVLADAKEMALTYLTFGKSARHHDFGSGIAPFVAFRLTPDTKVIEAEAPLQLMGFAYGGDGAARYVAPAFLFYDEAQRRVDSTIIDASQAFTGYGARSFFTFVAVPKGATHVVVTTDPRQNNQSELGVIRSRPEERLTARSQRFFAIGGVLPYAYRHANYGPIRVRPLPNE